MKKISIGIHFRAPDSKSSSVQISNATVGLKHLILQRNKAKFFRSAYKTGAIPDQVQLKSVVLRRR